MHRNTSQSGIPVAGSPRMPWSYNRTTHTILAGAMFLRKPHIHFKVDNFQYQNTIYLILIVHIIYLIGIPGNILTLIVLQKRSLNDNFVSLFLSAMCLVDLWCLITGFSAYWWMAVTNGSDIRENSEFACFFHWFVTIMGLQANEWLMVLVSACRIHVIVSRSRIQAHESKVSGLLILGLMYTIILLPGYFIVRHSVSTNYVDGEIVDCDFDLADALETIYFSIALLLPPVVVMVENFLMYYLYRKSMPPIMRRRPANIAANQRMKMLIVMTDITFFVTSIPPLLFYEISKTLFQPEDRIMAASRKYELVLMFTVLYAGFAFNVVIYCCFGRRFRTELKMLLLKPVQRLGYCRGARVREARSIRHQQQIPFSVYTSSISNHSEMIAANILGFSEKQLDGNKHDDNHIDDNQLESLEKSVLPVLWRVEGKSVNPAGIARNLRNRQDEDSF